MDMRVEEIQELVALILLQLRKTGDETWVDVERFESGDWMSAYGGMMCVNGWPVWSGACQLRVPRV